MSRLRHGSDRAGSVGPYKRHHGHAAGGGDMHRSAVAADVERGTLDQRAQLGQGELAAGQHAVAKRSWQALASGLNHAGAASASDGPDVTMTRIVGSRAASIGRDVRERGTGQRRNGLPGAHVDDDDRAPRSRRRATPIASTTCCGGGLVERHLDRVALGAWRRHTDRRQQIPLVLDRVPARSSRGRLMRSVYIHARPATLVADAPRGPAQPRQQRRAGATMKVDGEVESHLARVAGQGPGPPAIPSRRVLAGRRSPVRERGLPDTTGAAGGSTR